MRCTITLDFFPGYPASGTKGKRKCSIGDLNVDEVNSSSQVSNADFAASCRCGRDCVLLETGVYAIVHAVEMRAQAHIFIRAQIH
jgi:hypothetical protein